MSEFETATLTLQEATLWTGYGQLAIAFVQTLILAYGVYVMRGMSADRQADAQARDRETAQRQQQAERQAAEREHQAEERERQAERRHAENMQALHALIERTAPPPAARQ